MGLDLNTALISDTFDGLIKTQDGNVLTSSPLIVTDGRGNNSSLALATAGNGAAITGTFTVDGVNILSGLTTAQGDITAIETKTDFITVTGSVNLDTIKTKADFITVTQAVDLDTVESDILSAKTKTDFITVSQAVNLDTMESDILSAKTKTDFITIGQPVNLDNVESDVLSAKTKTDFITITQAVNLDQVESNLATAQNDITAIKAKTNFISITQNVDLDTIESDTANNKSNITSIEAKTDFIAVNQPVNLDTMESDIASAKAKTDLITITQAVDMGDIENDISTNQTLINQIKGKTDLIAITQGVNLDTMESDIAANNAKNSYPAADATKVGFISVTQAVDLDSLETNVSNLTANKYDKTGGTITGNVLVTGDLTVQGQTVTADTLSITDSFVELANSNEADVIDSGFYAHYSEDAGVTIRYTGLFRDASDSDKFKLFKGLTVKPTTTVNTAGTGYAKGDLIVAGLEADSLSGPLTGNVTGNLSGNVTGNLTGTVLTAAQPNITSVGTLSSLAVTGNLTVDTNTLFVDASLNAVGIGDNPDANSKLRVSGGGIDIEGDNAIRLRFFDGTTFQSGIQSVLSVGEMINGSSAGDLAIRSNSNVLFAAGGNSERMRIDSSGKLLINTTGVSDALLNLGDRSQSPVRRLQLGKEVNFFTVSANDPSLQVGESQRLTFSFTTSRLSSIIELDVTQDRTASDTASNHTSAKVVFHVYMTTANNATLKHSTLVSGDGLDLTDFTFTNNADGTFTIDIANTLSAINITQFVGVKITGSTCNLVSSSII